jgi:phosphoribosylformylglycinamidine synthase
VEAVLECARNLACVGAQPLGLTNCLNFGNPEKPHIAWQLTRAVEGLRDACLAVGAPVVGGNVSLYNEGGGGPIFPTPVVGMVGKLPDPAAVPWSAFREPGHAIALVGPFQPSSAGSELEKLQGRHASELPAVDLTAQAAALDAIRAAVRSGAAVTAHDVSEGGLACALAESAIRGGIGASVELEEGFPLFGEGPGGVLLAGPRDGIEALEETLQAHGFHIIGETGGDRIDITAGIATLSVPVAVAQDAHDGSLPSRFE